MSKKSIRFFNDREVRAVWDDENSCWWFSATDVVRAINDEPDYTKAGNYWRWLKRKLKQEDVQFVSDTHKLKIVAADDKQYITLEERDKIADFDLSANPSLEVQRDIFIFQCLIGCRVSDLMSMTPASIINGAVEYIAQKTKGERPKVVRVPLNSRAKALVEKYSGRDDLNGKLFPFISSQKYNVAIKKIFTVCGINRMVTILNPTTGAEEKRPLNELAGSHLARRTFIGNLYKKVKDPNLVSSLSGHKEGSKAFARYRDIDEDMKKELVSLID